MPGGPDYPFDSSPRFPSSKHDAIRPVAAQGDALGVVHDASGDVRTWVISGALAFAARDIVTALAYLDVADILSDARHKEFKDRLSAMAATVEALKLALADQSQLLQQVASFLGVTIPAWLTLKEVNEGDDMGLVRPSAAELGLTVDMIPLQLEPGFGHEDVVSIDPAPGTIVARGTLVHVRVNFLG
jgi:hypothetical protein